METKSGVRRCGAGVLALVLALGPAWAAQDVRPVLPAAPAETADRAVAAPVAADKGAVPPRPDASGRNPFAVVEEAMVPPDYDLAASLVRLSALVAVAEGCSALLLLLPDDAAATDGRGGRYQRVLSGDWLNLRMAGRDYIFRVTVTQSEVSLLAESGAKYGLTL
ncbi:hypothetical protein [Desulfuromonas thiophila]|nr:hypothetical protein [Desulfuromonas thiophila]